MLELNAEQRTLLGEKLCDAGNLAVGALFFGQFLGTHFSSLLACAGLVLWMGLILWALAITRGKEP